MPSYLSPQWMLLYGLGLSLLFPQEHKFKQYSKIGSKNLLQLSIILLGSNLKISEVIGHGAKGFGITLITLSFIFVVGYILNKFFRLEQNQSILITVGTAICGGSAIAAVAPVIKASAAHIAMSMGVVFFLNALAIFIFPPLGHFLELSQAEFGLFSALAIHDTSSVVAASSLYGQEAMKLATTYKLTRALWIIPLTLYFSIRQNKDQIQPWFKKIKIPTFILGFILISLVFSLVPTLSPLRPYFSLGSKAGLSLTLFFIGFAMEIKDIRASGKSSLLYGMLIWLFTIFLSYMIIIFSR